MPVLRVTPAAYSRVAFLQLPASSECDLPPGF